MKLLIETTCRYCGAVDEGRFEWKAHNLKQTCMSCGRYLRHYKQEKFPSAKTIKLRIWEIANKDVDLIQHIKDEIEFEELDGINEQVMYWNLYLQIREVLA